MFKRVFAWDLAVSVAIFAFTLAIYILTLSRSVYFGDSGEFIAVAKTLGIAHPPGYPLYTILAHLFTLLPFGNLAFKVNLFSAVTSSLTVVVAYFACLKLTKNRLASASASLFLAFSYLFWLYSLVAEVFALNNLFIALIILISLHIFANPANKKLFYLLAFVFGLALTNHHTIIFLVPALIFLILANNPKLLLNPKFILLNSLFILIGLLPYLYLPIRASQDPLLSWGDPETLDRFFHHILRRDYGTFILSPLTGKKFFNLDAILFYLSTFPKSFSFVGVILGICGFFFLFLTNKKGFYILLTAIIFLGPVFTIVTKSSADPLQKGVLERFFLASFPVFTIWICVGLTAVINIFRKWLKFFVYALILLFVFPLVSNYPKVNHSKNFIYEEYGRQIFEILPQNSLVFFSHDEVSMISQYLQTAQGLRPDLKLVNFTLLPAQWYKENLQRRYKDLQLPWDKFTRSNSQIQAGETICRQVVPVYQTFTDRWQTNAFPRNAQNCSYLPFGLLVRLREGGAQITDEEIGKELEFWNKVNSNPGGRTVTDLRTQNVLYTYSDLETFLGVTLIEAGQIEKSLNILHSAFEIYPNAVTAEVLSKKYQELGNFDKAIEWKEKIVAIFPKLATIHRDLGYLYLEQKNDKKKAYYYYQKYLHLSPEAEDKEQVELIVEKLKKDI